MDLRLAPVAAAVWAVSAARAAAHRRRTLALGAVGATGLAAAPARRGRRGRRPSPWRSSPGWPSPLATAAVREGRAGVLAAARRRPRRAARWSSSLELDDDPHVLCGVRRRARRRGRHRRRRDRRAGDAPAGRGGAALRARRRAGATLLPGPAGARPGGRLRAPARGRRGRRGVRRAARRRCSARPGALQRAAGALRDGPRRLRRAGPRPAAGRAAARSGRRRHAGHGPGARGGLPSGPGSPTSRRSPAPTWRSCWRRCCGRCAAGPSTAGCRRPSRWSLLLGFVVLARPSPSVVRAAAMGAVTLLALAAGRPRAALPALGAAVCVLLLLDPGLAADAGFALSVAATAAIVLVAPGWSRRLRDRGCWPVPGRRPRRERRRGPGHGAARRRPLAARSAWSRCRPTCSPPRPSRRRRCSGWRRTVVARAVPPVGDLLVWFAGWPTRWLVLVAERAAAVPDAATGWPAGRRRARCC